MSLSAMGPRRVSRVPDVGDIAVVDDICEESAEYRELLVLVFGIDAASRSREEE